MKTITDETPVAYDKDGTEIPADRLQKWAYNQLKAAPELAAALTELVDRFAANALNALAYDDGEPCCQLCGEPHNFKADPDNMLDRGALESWDEHHKPGCLLQQARAALAKVTA